MHRGRFGGNARKRKTKLNDDTFQAMISSPAAIVDMAVRLDVVENVETSFLVTEDQLETAEPQVLPRMAYSVRHAPARAFESRDYQFGYAVCTNCRSDQAYYVHQADLARGFTFRCRICQHELTVSADQASS